MPTISGLSVPIATAIIPGGVAGAHAVPGGLKPADTLLAVLQVENGPPRAVVEDLTAEFAITAGAAGSVTNTTTDTTGDFLVIVWAAAA